MQCRKNELLAGTHEYYAHPLVELLKVLLSKGTNGTRMNARRYYERQHPKCCHARSN